MRRSGITKVRIILVGAFVLVFTAGAVAGFAVPHWRARRAGPFLTRELNLSPEQHDQMRKIWREAVHESRLNRFERRRELRELRDSAIRQMLSPGQLAMLEEIQQSFELGLAELDRQRERAVERAVEQTKAVLTPEQAALYEELRPKGTRPARRPEFRRGAPRPGPDPREDNER